MIAQTSIKAYRANEPRRGTQKGAVFNALLQFAHMGKGATAEQLASMTNIRLTTVHARLCDLKAGYIHNEETYFVRVKEQCKVRGRSVQFYTITTDTPTYTLDEINAIKRAALSKLREWRRAYSAHVNSQLQTLFDK